MTNQPLSKPARSRAAVATAVAALLLAATGWAGFPNGAAAATRCDQYCSGPGKDFKECMERCIEREDPRAAEHSIRELCRSPGQDELACLRAHGLAGGPPPYPPPPAYVVPPAYAPPPPPPPLYEQPVQCYRDQYGRTVCPP
jgi:hypothetical protein